MRLLSFVPHPLERLFLALWVSYRLKICLLLALHHKGQTYLVEVVQASTGVEAAALPKAFNLSPWREPFFFTTITAPVIRHLSWISLYTLSLYCPFLVSTADICFFFFFFFLIYHETIPLGLLRPEIYPPLSPRASRLWCSVDPCFHFGSGLLATCLHWRDRIGDNIGFGHFHLHIWGSNYSISLYFCCYWADSLSFYGYPLVHFVVKCPPLIGSTQLLFSYFLISFL